MIILIYYKDTVASFGGHKLGSLYDENILLDSQSLSGSQSRYSTSDFFCLTHSAGVSTLFGKLLLYFLPNSLWLERANLSSGKCLGKYMGLYPCNRHASNEYLVFFALALATDITTRSDGHVVVEKRLRFSETLAARWRHNWRHDQCWKSDQTVSTRNKQTRTQTSFVAQGLKISIAFCANIK